ncbi:hypothetical protein [Flavobacterium foetidum]|uniref:hypothetical protein n=1 Tax=Flavobacterium foetidum TaxID=2026681 RepID=UPI00107547AA|nr:hypothetical protein [Flavobacterium foetidum]KAF2515705.1 hypothetical protein E0W73_08940 [Flavobacterium foetidum]
MSITRTILLLTILLIASCTGRKEKDLEAREQQLLSREKEFSAKEEDYKNLLKFRDSVLLEDSIKSDTAYSRVWPDSLKGSWNGRLICRESSCSTYVIGDQRTEKWIFENDSLGPLVKILDNNKLKRILRAEYISDKAELSFTPDSMASGNVKINAVLDNFSSKVIKGTQTLTGRDGCLVKFSIELSSASKK